MDSKESKSACAVWDFRANGDLWTDEWIHDWLNANAREWTLQVEESDSGYNHYQGRMRLIKKRTKQPLLNLFKGKPPNYLAPTSKENYQEEFFYAMKEDTRIREPWNDKMFKEKFTGYIPRQYRDIELYPWQDAIIKSLDIFNTRHINIIYDRIGNNGKSTLAAIGELKYKCIDMPPMNDFDKLMQVACNICMSKELRSPKGMFFDLPRALAKDKLYGLYSAIEQIKKGKLYDWRNHYKEWWIDSPVIWVFSNHLPDEKLLSNDRWIIWELKNDILVRYNPLTDKSRHIFTVSDETLTGASLE